ncbi:MAG: hypothetical protein JXR96_16495 [Deltaproteobacteria bacterium]|nr:hypothetical protein [Deltaproteobacteria bacterium]
MGPILFWLFGSISVLAALAAVATKRPVRSLQALVVMMIAVSAVLFVMSAALLASELLLGSLVGSVLVWMALVRPGKGRLGAAGRTRLNVSKILGLFSALSLGALLTWAVVHTTSAGAERPEHVLGAAFGFWVTILLLGSAAVTAWLVVTRRRGEESQEEP